MKGTGAGGWWGESDEERMKEKKSGRETDGKA